MTVTQSQFRFFVFLSLAFSTLWVFYLTIFENRLSNVEIEAFTYYGAGAILNNEFLDLVLVWGAFFLGIIIYTSLFMLKRWAVWALLLFDIFTLVWMGFLSGISVETAAMSVFRNVFVFCDGVIIALGLSSNITD